MATQQEQRRRLRRNSARSGSGGGTGSTPQQEQRRGARRNQPRGGSGTSSARGRGGGVRFSRNAGTGGTGGGPRASATSGAGPRAPAPDVTVDRSGGGKGRFNKNPLTGNKVTRGAGAVGRGAMAGLRLGGQLLRLGPQAAIFPTAVGAGSDQREGGPFRGEGASDISPERAAELEAAGGTLPEGVPTAEEVEAATTPGAEDPSEITWSDRNGRIRLPGNRPETVGREGTRIDSARGDEAEAARLQLGAPAPELPGTSPNEQEIIRATDGQGGVGVLRAPAGARQGGGTFSTMENVAAAAVPVDTQGVHEARMAAVQRGERLPSEGGGPSRRERLRREIRQTQGLDQTLSSAMAEGLRRRSNRRELDAMDAQALQRQQNQAAMQRTMAGRQPTALDVAEFESDQREQQAETAQQQRENERAQREEFRDIVDRRYNPDTEEGRRQRNRVESLARRSGWGQSPQGAQVAMDVMEVGDALNNAIQNENEFQIADLWGGGPDNPLSNVPALPVSVITNLFGLSGQRPADAQTVQDGMAQILDMRHTRTDEEVVPWDQDDRIVEVDGTEIEMSDIPSEMRTLIDHIRARAGQEGLHNPDAPSGVFGGG